LAVNYKKIKEFYEGLSNKKTNTTITKYNMSISITKAISEIQGGLIGNVYDFIKDYREKDQWETFGKRNSHTYRSKLYRLMNLNNLKIVDKFMVQFLLCVINNQKRCLEAMNAIPDQSSKEWFKPVHNFIKNRCVQYTNEETNDKISVVHVPSCNPGMDMLTYALSTKKENRSVEEMMKRKTAHQLALDAEMQAEAKEGYRYFWDVVVTGSRNTNSKEKPMFREEYYRQSAGDNYLLITNEIEELVPEDAETGYTRMELKKWLDSIK